MPCTYDIRTRDRLIVNTVSGELHTQDVMDLSARLRADPLFDPYFPIIQDFRKVEKDNIDFAGMISITSDIKRVRTATSPPLRMGLLAPSDVSYGMSRMFQTLMQNTPNASIVVERNCDDLIAAMGLPTLTAKILNAEPE